jgi:hypothetical protein
MENRELETFPTRMLNRAVYNTDKRYFSRASVSLRMRKLLPGHESATSQARQNIKDASQTTFRSAGILNDLRILGEELSIKTVVVSAYSVAVCCSLERSCCGAFKPFGITRCMPLLRQSWVVPLLPAACRD